MRHSPYMSFDEYNRRKRRFRISSALTLMAGLLVAPFVYEATLIGLAQWRGMNGVAREARTPILDTMRAVLQDAKHDADSVLPALFRRIPWTPATVIPFAIFWTGLAALILRKC